MRTKHPMIGHSLKRMLPLDLSQTKQLIAAAPGVVAVVVVGVVAVVVVAVVAVVVVAAAAVEAVEAAVVVATNVDASLLL